MENPSIRTLSGFYGRIGFEPVSDEEMPGHRAPRAAHYRAMGPHDPMRRPAEGAP